MSVVPPSAVLAGGVAVGPPLTHAAPIRHAASPPSLLPARRHAAATSGTGTRPQSSGPTAGRTACPGRAATLCEAGRPRLTPLVAIPTLRLLPTHCPLQRLPALLARPAQLHRRAVRAARGARHPRGRPCAPRVAPQPVLPPQADVVNHAACGARHAAARSQHPPQSCDLMRHRCRS